jgi:hypothetical protein
VPLLYRKVKLVASVDRRGPVQLHPFLISKFDELRETEIDVLVRKGLLNRGRRDDPNAIVKALHAHLDRTLGRTL